MKASIGIESNEVGPYVHVRLVSMRIFYGELQCSKFYITSLILLKKIKKREFHRIRDEFHPYETVYGFQS